MKFVLSAFATILVAGTAFTSPAHAERCIEHGPVVNCWHHPHHVIIERHIMHDHDRGPVVIERR